MGCSYESENNKFIIFAKLISVFFCFCETNCTDIAKGMYKYGRA